MVDSLAEFAVVTYVCVCVLCVCQRRQPFGHEMFSSLAVSVSLRRPPPARCKPIVNSSELKLKGDASGVTLCYLKLLLICIFFFNFHIM